MLRLQQACIRRAPLRSRAAALTSGSAAGCRLLAVSRARTPVLRRSAGSSAAALARRTRRATPPPLPAGRRRLLSNNAAPKRAEGGKKGSSGGSSGGGGGGGGSDSVKNLPLKGFATGALAGAFGSWVGLGGGFVSLPLLTMALRLTQHQAHGTSLCAVTATGFAGAVGYASSGHIDLPAAAVIATAGMLFAGFGARAAHALNASALQKALGVFMLLVAPTVPLKDDILAAIRSKRPHQSSAPAAAGRQREHEPQEQRDGEGGDKEGTLGGAAAGSSAGTQPSAALSVAPEPSSVAATTATATTLATTQENGSTTLLPLPLQEEARLFAAACIDHAKRGVLLIGAGSGFLAGLFGVGGGAVTIPALAFTTDFDHHTALGTSLAAMVLPSISGMLVHFRAGAVIVPVAIPLACGSLAGAFLGAKVGVHIPEKELKAFFGVVMVFLGGRTVLKAFTK